MTPCLLGLTKIENWPKLWKWNAKAIKHKWGQCPLHCFRRPCSVNHVYKICRWCVSDSVLLQCCSEIQCMCTYVHIWKQIRTQSNCDKMIVNFLIKSLISNLLVVCESAPWSSLLASHPEFGFIGKMQLEEYSEYNGKFDFIFLS